MLERAVPPRREDARTRFVFAATLEESLEHADQHQPCAMDASMDFPRGSLQEGGSLPRRQLREIAKDESRPNAVVDVLERLAKQAGEVAALKSRVAEVAPFSGGRDQAAGSIASHRKRFQRAPRHGTSAALPLRQDCLDCGSAEPGSQADIAPDRGNLAASGDEGLTSQLLCFARGGAHVPHDAVDRVAVAAHQHGEGRVGSLSGIFDEHLVGPVGRWELVQLIVYREDHTGKLMRPSWSGGKVQSIDL